MKLHVTKRLCMVSITMQIQSQRLKALVLYQPENKSRDPNVSHLQSQFKVKGPVLNEEFLEH